MGVWGRLLAWSDRHRFAVDAVAATLLAIVGIPATTADILWDGASTPVHSVTYALIAAAMIAPLAWRRVRPAASAAVVYAVALGHLVLGAPLILPADLVVLIALWSVTVHGPRWAARVAVVGGMVGSLLLGVRVGTGLDGFVIMSMMTGLALVATWSVALARRARREALDSLVDRARRLEVERDQQARLAAAAERSRIARELHDIVAHSLSVMIAQADGGRYAAAADPQAATRSLATIAETGRAALTDMRRLLGVLRTEPETPPSRDSVDPPRRSLARTLAAAAAAISRDPRSDPRPAPNQSAEPGAAPTGPLPMVADRSSRLIRTGR